MVIFKFGLQASRRQLEFLVAPRRIGFPAAAGGTVPVELPRLESAVLAMVARQALSMAVYEIADELQIVAPFGGRDQELRFEQLVQPEQGLIAAQLVLHQLVCRLGPLPGANASLPTARARSSSSRFPSARTARSPFPARARSRRPSSSPFPAGRSRAGISAPRRDAASP